MSIKFFDMFSGIGGFEDARGTLFFEIARIAEVKRPKEILNKALKSLTKKQRKRIILHYSGMTEREIAEIEKVDQKTIHESIDKAEKHLKKAKLKLSNKQFM